MISANYDGDVKYGPTSAGRDVTIPLGACAAGPRNTEALPQWRIAAATPIRAVHIQELREGVK